MKKYFVVFCVICLVTIFSSAILAQGKGNRRNSQPADKPAKNAGQRNNGSNTPPKSDGMVYQKITPCNQMNDDAGIAKNRQCKMPNGQITTVGKFCDDYPTESVCGQNNSNRNGRSGNNKRQTANGQNQATGGTIPVYAKDQKAAGKTNGVLVQNENITNSRLRRSGRANRQPPANTQVVTSSANSESAETILQGKTNNGGLQETQYDFVYPTNPEAIVTWNENSGPYGYTTANSGWEFIQTSAGIAVRRSNEEGTVVAHTKCNDSANYTFGYGGNNGSIDMIMCRPKQDGLPRLKPSIMIVPKGQQ